jgi:hypothetical protein
MYLLMSKDMNVAKEAGIEGDDEKEFIVTGISLLEVGLLILLSIFSMYSILNATLGFCKWRRR